jgi:hypothetical protein
MLNHSHRAYDEVTTFGSTNYRSTYYCQQRHEHAGDHYGDIEEPRMGGDDITLEDWQELARLAPDLEPDSKAEISISTMVGCLGLINIVMTTSSKGNTGLHNRQGEMLLLLMLNTSRSPQYPESRAAIVYDTHNPPLFACGLTAAAAAPEVIHGQSLILSSATGCPRAVLLSWVLQMLSGSTLQSRGWQKYDYQHIDLNSPVLWLHPTTGHEGAGAATAKSIWEERRKTSIEQSLRTLVDFLLGNSMLLRQSNCLPLELTDLCAMPLPKEGQGTWCLVAALHKGKHCLHSGYNVLIY